jgi:hypothetical protein
MITHRGRFNIYLLLLIIVVLIPACTTSGSNKEVSIFRLHLEVNHDGTDKNKPVPVYRANPVMVNVETSPFITEAHVSEASLIDTMGGFAIKVQLERRGTWLLEQYSTANRGKRVAVYSEFTFPADSKTNVVRWLAAPMLSKRIADGVFVFTPDASKEESEALVHGLSKLAKKLNDSDKW